MPRGRGNPPFSQGPGRISLGPGSDQLGGDLRAQGKSLLAIIKEQADHAKMLFSHTKSITKLLTGSLPAGASGDLQFNDSGKLGGGLNLFWDKVNGFLGIGTSTPGTLLHVKGTISVTLFETTGADVAGFRLKQDAAGVDLKVWTIETAHSLGDVLRLCAVNDAVTVVLATPITCFRDGHVVIGTTIMPGTNYLAADTSPGLTQVVALAPLTALGTAGSATFKNGILTAYSAPT